LGAEMMKPLIGAVGVRPFTYCGNDPPVGESNYAKFLVRLRAYHPDYGTLSMGNLVNPYDIIYTPKAPLARANTTHRKRLRVWRAPHTGRRTAAASTPLSGRPNHFSAVGVSVARVPDIKNARWAGLLRGGGG